MYSAPHPVSTSMNGMGNELIDGSGTINPAALNPSVLPTPTSLAGSNTSPRGLKRSRSPDYGDLSHGQGDDDSKPRERERKRGRPPKTGFENHQGLPPNHTQIQTPQQPTHQIPTQQLRTPQLQTQSLPQQTNITPTQTSAPKATPTKTVKALPTVRDHTTDQLNAERDEYLPREIDEAGEKKVSPTGRPLDGREYKCRTFLVPNRGDKLFMLATECARNLNYRDSYLLFNKNRSLYKIIASQPEKDDLIHQEILPYSYRSRQIAIVTAKSMFRQFGSRVIKEGRRVRDDYWEAKARKQGFTEDDLAGEKRPGGAKAARDAQAAEAANAAAISHHPDIIYSQGPQMPIDIHGQPQYSQSLGGPMAATLAPLPLPMILAPTDDRRRQFEGIVRPRQEVTGPAYQDRTQPSSATDIVTQATQTAEFSKALNQQSMQRGKYMNDIWKQSRDVPVSTPQQHPSETGPTITQSLQSPQVASGAMMNAGHQQMLQHQSQMISPQAYSQPHQQSAIAQSPVRSVQQQIRPEQMQQPHRSSSMGYGVGGAQQSSQYGYSQPSQSWGGPPPQPQQSPQISHHAGLPQYAHPQQQHQQPHQSQSPHPSQSPHAHPPPLQHSQSTGSMHSGMGYQGMQNIAQPTYGAMGVANRNVYQQPQQSHSPQAYLQSQSTTAAQATLQGWAPPPTQAQAGQQGWSTY